jgi:PPK2 family polyphosphate:nucleotide phosphotransferase
MKIDKYTVKNGKGFDLSKFETASESPLSKKERVQILNNNRDKIAELQSKLYADSKAAVLIIFQAMDGAGKDGAIKHVMSGINPQGVNVHSFKQPSLKELSHDFLWRMNQCLPERGKIAIFNRSYYEDVLIVKVHKLYERFNILPRCKDDKVIERRYGHIVNYEQYLYDSGIHVVKFFLNLSKEEQRRRFLKRLDRPDKNWKFSEGDIAERGFWDDYQKAYVKAIQETATNECPWYVVPADDKPYTRMIVSEVLRSVLEEINPEYPQVSKEQQQALLEYRERI